MKTNSTKKKANTKDTKLKQLKKENAKLLIENRILKFAICKDILKSSDEELYNIFYENAKTNYTITQLNKLLQKMKGELKDGANE